MKIHPSMLHAQAISQVGMYDQNVLGPLVFKALSLEFALTPLSVVWPWTSYLVSLCLMSITADWKQNYFLGLLKGGRWGNVCEEVSKSVAHRLCLLLWLFIVIIDVFIAEVVTLPYCPSISLLFCNSRGTEATLYVK